MAGIETTLVTFLKTLGTVTAIVGSGDDALIRPDRLEESDSPPAIIIEVDADSPANSLDGKGGLVYSDVNIICRAREKVDARALAEAVRLNGTDPGTGLAGYHGTVGGVQFDAVLEDMVPSFTPADDASQRGWFDVNCSYEVSFLETV